MAIPTSDTITNGWQAWELLRTGASDVFVWSARPEVPEQIKARFERWRAVDALMNSSSVQDRLIGVSPIWRSVLRQVVEIARFTTASILLIGESGTGKELIARLIHELDPRASNSEFVILDCTTVVPELSGSEFFGHERGTFTDAVSSRDGGFALADGGTLFLDEVGELSVALQSQLLRVVREGTYSPPPALRREDIRSISGDDHGVRYGPSLNFLWEFAVTSSGSILPRFRRLRRTAPLYFRS